MPSFKDIFKIIFISVLFKKKERLIEENNIVCVHKIFRVKTLDSKTKTTKLSLSSFLPYSYYSHVVLFQGCVLKNSRNSRVIQFHCNHSNQ